MRREKEMKTVKLVVLFVCLLGIATQSYAQLAVFDGAVSDILAKTGIDQVIYYAQSIEQMIQNAQNTYNQYQNMIRAEQRALENLKSIADVRSFDGFMEWQNRQLYLERQAEYRFKNMGIKIGDKNYTMKNVEDIPEGIRNNFGDPYWEDFTEAQRKKMWTQLGLSPSNYMYVKTWQEREDAIAQKILTKKGAINEDNMTIYEIFRSTAGRYATENENIGEKEILMDTHMTLMDVSKTLRDILYDMAEKNEMELARQKQAAAPPNPPRVSGHWNSRFFKPITED
jgi:membrane-associated HD superfamily phosphohydrolase